MRMLDNVIDINFYTVPEGALLQSASSASGSRHHGLSGCALCAAHSFRVG